MSESGEIRLQHFEKGDAIEVPLARVEAELSALWRQAATKGAGPEDKKAPRAVTRACLWNLIVRVGNDEFASAKKLIDELSKSIPARVIILHTDPAAPEQPIRAWVEANWRRPDGGHASGSDEVTLLATGAAVDRLPSLVRALVITDAPTAMLWWGAPPAADSKDRPAVRGLWSEIDRLIVDTRKLPSETGMVDYERIAAQFPALELVDCAWLGVRPLRGLCAGLFDPPGDPDRLLQLDRVRVVSGVTGCQSRGLLTLGWLASRLGWRALRRDTSTGDIRRWRADRPAGGTVLIELETRLGGANHGVRGLELEAGPDRWILKRENQCLDVTRSDGPGRRQPVRTHTDAELVTSALGARGRDAIFRDALGHAVKLVAAP